MGLHRSARRLCAAALCASALSLVGCYRSYSTNGAAAPIFLRPELSSLDTGKPLGLHLTGTVLFSGGLFQIPPEADPIRFNITAGSKATFDIKVMLLPERIPGGARGYIGDPQSYSIVTAPSVLVTSQSTESGLGSVGWLSLRAFTHNSYPQNHPAQAFGRLLALTLAHLVVATDGENVTRDHALLSQVAITGAEIFVAGPPPEGADKPVRVEIRHMWPVPATRPPAPPETPPASPLPEGAPPAL